MRTIPSGWMPPAAARRVVVHWTAGAWKASAVDREHYHIMVEDDGNLVRGDRSIADNDSTADGRYAAHTRGLNTGSIGIAACGMAGAIERPFSAGKYPITEAQWATLADVCAQLCKRYGIPVTRQTVLSHAEVQPTLGIAQAGKWDIAVLPVDRSVSGAIAVGDRLREMVRARLAGGPSGPAPRPDPAGAEVFDPGIRSDRVAAVQERLVELGYPEVGKVDGLYGSRTRSALNAFRRAHGLPEQTGFVLTGDDVVALFPSADDREPPHGTGALAGNAGCNFFAKIANLIRRKRG